MMKVSKSMGKALEHARKVHGTCSSEYQAFYRELLEQYVERYRYQLTQSGEIADLMPSISDTSASEYEADVNDLSGLTNKKLDLLESELVTQERLLDRRKRHLGRQRHFINLGNVDVAINVMERGVEDIDAEIADLDQELSVLRLKPLVKKP